MAALKLGYRAISTRITCETILKIVHFFSKLGNTNELDVKIVASLAILVSVCQLVCCGLRRSS